MWNRAGFILCGVVLAGLAMATLFFDLTPAATFELALEQHLLPTSQTLQEQEVVLSKEPADPFGWARLAYLRRAVAHNKRGAFEALQMSDYVSPYEPRQLAERLKMWQELRSVQNADERANEAALAVRAKALR